MSRSETPEQTAPRAVRAARSGHVTRDLPQADVEKAYGAWAHVYDATCARLFAPRIARWRQRQTGLAGARWRLASAQG